MFTKRQVWQLFAAFFLIAALSLLAASWYAGQVLEEALLKEVRQDLQARAAMLSLRVRDAFLTPNQADYQRICQQAGAETRTRFTLIRPSGQVIADSEADPASMEDHSDRPEIGEAVSGRIGSSTRFSNTIQKTLVYVAIPVLEGSQVAGVVRASVHFDSLENTLSALNRRLALGGAVVISIAGLLSWGLSRRVSRPLEHLKRGAERIAGGDFTHKLTVPDSEEIGALADAMNQMAIRLDERIRAIEQQRNEQDALLSSMSEGILVVDEAQRIVRLNRAAAELLGADPDQARSKPVTQSVRNDVLKRLIFEALSSSELAEADVYLPESEKYIQARATPISDSLQSLKGVVMTLNDFTRIRKLEMIRRQFASNASHQLKTPITAIKGFAETLLEGALEDPRGARRFVQIIANQADRLQELMEELLGLSRIEQAAESGHLERSWCRLSEILKAASESRAALAAEKRIQLSSKCPQAVSAQVNSTLLTQAVGNLLDNAIRYSPSRSRVRLSAGEQGESVWIAVEDNGPGIAKSHQSRIFERFYRIEGEGSSQPGTGLGLAIVRHIVKAHAGEIQLESRPGQGSKFTIRIPKY